MTHYQLLGQKVQKVANTALLVTPIISRQNPPVVQPLGSGLFLEIDDDYFLVTAGHLLNLLDRKDLLVPGNNNQMIWLNGVLATTFDKFSLKSNIDFAVLKFSNRQIKHLIGGYHKSVKSNRILINHSLHFSDNYVVAGYPINGIKKTYGKPVYTPIPLKLLTHPIPLKNYKKYGFDPNNHILLKYQITLKPFNSKVNSVTKDATGISGSGLWFVPDWNDSNYGIPNFYLIGVMIENHKDKGFLVALKIDFVTETIRKIFGKKNLGVSSIDVGGAIKTLYCAEMP